MKVYGVQTKFQHIDDTVTLFTSKKKALEYLNERWKNNEGFEYYLKEFEFINGKAYDINIELPF